MLMGGYAVTATKLDVGFHTLLVTNIQPCSTTYNIDANLHIILLDQPTLRICNLHLASSPGSTQLFVVTRENNEKLGGAWGRG